jgi:hypothetical protein
MTPMKHLWIAACLAAAVAIGAGGSAGASQDFTCSPPAGNEDHYHPAVSVTPDIGAVGDTVEVDGTGWRRQQGCQADLWVVRPNVGNVHLGTAFVDARGEFAFAPYVVLAEDVGTYTTFTVAFEVCVALHDHCQQTFFTIRPVF